MKYDIHIRDLKIFAYHGVNKEEKRDGQNFLVDCDMQISTPCIYGFIKDSVDETISYAKAAKFIKEVMLRGKFDLIEAAVDYVAKELFFKFKKLKKLDITLKKPDAPIRDVDFGYVAVRIKRRRFNFRFGRLFSKVKEIKFNEN